MMSNKENITCGVPQAIGMINIQEIQPKVYIKDALSGAGGTTF